MNRVVIFEDQKLMIQTRSTPNLHQDEALIRLHIAGICSTDIALMRGYKGFSGVLGHEFVGEVIDGPIEWMGQRVVGEINISCGSCDMCTRGYITHCRQRKILGISGDYDGVFADTFKLPLRNLHCVPESLRDEEAVFTEPLAAAAEILEQVHLHPGDEVYVLGVGRLGMLVVQVLYQSGVNVVGVVRHEIQGNLLRQWGIQARTRAELPNYHADIVVDCTGNAAGFAEALTLVRPRGILVLKSTYEGLGEVDLSKVVVNEISVIGSRCGPFDVALSLLADRQIDTQSLIDAKYSLNDAARALEHASEPGVLKVLLYP